jgi:hypothetical protein
MTQREKKTRNITTLSILQDKKTNRGTQQRTSLFAFQEKTIILQKNHEIVKIDKDTH